jgi:hypothetical protein
MSIQLRGSQPSPVAEVDAGNAALRVTARGADVGSNGSYLLSAATGSLSAVAAGTATAGFIFAFRWTHATQICVINKIAVRWATEAGFTAEQTVGVAVFVGRSYGTVSSGGTTITLTGEAMKKRASYGTTNLGDARIATTGALTVGAGSVTLDQMPIMQGYARELATGAAIPKQVIALDRQWDIGQSMPLQLTQNMGILVRNEVLMGAAGTARVVVDLDWSEVSSY